MSRRNLATKLPAYFYKLAAALSLLDLLPSVRVSSQESLVSIIKAVSYSAVPSIQYHSCIIQYSRKYPVSKLYCTVQFQVPVSQLYCTVQSQVSSITAASYSTVPSIQCQRCIVQYSPKYPESKCIVQYSPKYTVSKLYSTVQFQVSSITAV